MNGFPSLPQLPTRPLTTRHQVGGCKGFLGGERNLESYARVSEAIAAG
jgi:hypothetical protein